MHFMEFNTIGKKLGRNYAPTGRAEVDSKNDVFGWHDEWERNEMRDDDNPPPVSSNHGSDQGRHAVVAVIVEESKYLVIRRSQYVRAPGLLCFPGGGIEPGEDLETALHRELEEELAMRVSIEKHLWTSVTRWGTRLEWLLCRRLQSSQPIPCPAEVAEVLWMEPAQLRERPDLLGSLPDFFEAIEQGHIDLA
jgi:8-oxo-dGTP pyrophosphatase MutT (NUDIX family)